MVSKKQGMTVCYFGIYKPGYSRNKILIKGLKANGIEIIECNSRLNGFAKYRDLIKKHRCLKNEYDAMIVGFPGYQAVILARFLTKKPIIFDAFCSIYDAMVLDRQATRRLSPRALYFWLLDWLSCRLADKIILDTNEHIKYFIKNFRLSPEKFIRVIIGADTEIYKPVRRAKTNKTFTVHFHGSFIPSQGINYIVEAAAILKNKDIIFNIVGHGQNFDFIKNKIAKLRLGNTIILPGFLPLADLLASINNADLCLGIFGRAARTSRVISNKIFECLASRKAMLTAGTPALKEIFTEQEIAFCRPADSQDLAQKILFLKNNPAIRESLAEQSYNFFHKNLEAPALTAGLAEIITSLAENNAANRKQPSYEK